MPALDQNKLVQGVVVSLLSVSFPTAGSGQTEAANINSRLRIKGKGIAAASPDIRIFDFGSGTIIDFPIFPSFFKNFLYVCRVRAGNVRIPLMAPAGGWVITRNRKKCY